MVSEILDYSSQYGFTIDLDRCTHLSKRLIHMHDTLGLGKYVPEIEYSRQFTYNPRKHMLFLLLSTAQDSRKQSKQVYLGGMRLVKEYAYEELLEICKTNKAELYKIAREYFQPAGRPGQILESCITILDQKYEGNALKIFAGIDDPDEARKRATDFSGVGNGISALLVKNSTRFKFLTPKDPYDLPIKIDRHALHLSVSNRVVRFTIPTGPKGVYRANLEKALEIAYRKVCREEQIDPIALDDAKWAVGSEICQGPNSTCKTMCDLGCSEQYSHRIDTRKGLPIVNENYYLWPAAPKVLPLFDDNQKS